MLFRGKEKTLGKARGKRRYDLPLNKGAGTGFLVLLIGLMTFLAAMALAASFALSAMTGRWSSGLENKVTVEIPAENEQGAIIPPAEIADMTARVAGLLQQHPAIAQIHVLDDKEIAGLIQPWLGEDLSLEGIPVPGLISLEMKDIESETLRALESRIKTIAPAARLDTHEEWLGDLLSFTGALQFAAALLTAIIGVTTAAAVGGAVRARMAVHADEVQILHLMGAADNYISRQFQRHSLILALKGAAAGLVAGSAALGLIGWSAGGMDVALLPDFHLTFWHVAGLAALPLAAGAIAMLAAARTVHHVLARMP